CFRQVWNKLLHDEMTREMQTHGLPRPTQRRGPQPSLRVGANGPINAPRERRAGCGGLIERHLPDDRIESRIGADRVESGINTDGEEVEDPLFARLAEPSECDVSVSERSVDRGKLKRRDVTVARQHFQL